MNKFILATWLSRISFMVAIVLPLTLSLFPEQVFSRIWHFKNKSYRILGHIKVTIPDEMIAIKKTGKNSEKQDSFNILSADFQRTRFILLFAQLPDDKPFPMKKIFKSRGHRKMQDLPCHILNQECQWIQSYSGKNKYEENIFMTRERIWISFTGKPVERVHLLNVISKLEYKDQTDEN